MPKIDIDGLEVYFPYPSPYPEQVEYMRYVKRSLEAKGHCMLEMPSGTGKTMSLLSVITSYQRMDPKCGKLLYCSRTVSEIEKVTDELKSLAHYMSEEGIEVENLWLSMSSRMNLCLNEGAASLPTGVEIDSKCHGYTCSWVREKAQQGIDIETCPFFESFVENDIILPKGVFSLVDLKRFARNLNICPYYLARRSLEVANIVVFSYLYLLDPKISEIVSKTFDESCIVVFDEAHNIDNVCIDALSVTVTQRMLKSSLNSVRTFQKLVNGVSAGIQSNLEREYRSILSGLRDTGRINVNNSVLSSASIPKNLVQDAIPGSIRKAKHFLLLLKRLIDFFGEFLTNTRPLNLYPLSLLQNLMRTLAIDSKVLSYLPIRFGSLVEALEVTNVYSHFALQKFLHFLQLLSNYNDGFLIIIENGGRGVEGAEEMQLQFCCLDSSLAVAPIFSRFRSVVITSGTLSPFSMYTRLLKFDPIITRSIDMTLKRECILPLAVTRGDDQTPLSTKFEVREDPSVIRNFGTLLSSICSNVPDGVVVFFPSYKYLEDTVMSWSDMGILSKILGPKLLFVETSSYEETINALDNYRSACDCGRGGLLFAVSRGKLNEGIDFSDHYGRCVVVIGVPFINTQNLVLCARLEYLRRTYSIKEGEFLIFDAMRTTSQCIGRILRSKEDYGIIIMADKRYSRPDLSNKFPRWIRRSIKSYNQNISTDMAPSRIRNFLSNIFRY